MEINLIVALGKAGEIGKNGGLIWKIPEDLKRFKSLTTGHTVIMGRKTWDSLPKKPLPGRRNIVITRQKDFRAEGAEIADSIETALRLLGSDAKPFIMGGEEIYNAFLPFVTTYYLTEIEDNCQEADSFLKLNFDKDWVKIEESDIFSTPEGVRYRYVTYKKLK